MSNFSYPTAALFIFLGNHAHAVRDIRERIQDDLGFFEKMNDSYINLMQGPFATALTLGSLFFLAIVWFFPREGIKEITEGETIKHIGNLRVKYVVPKNTHIEVTDGHIVVEVEPEICFNKRL